MTLALLIAVMAGAIVAATPLVLAAIGEVFAEVSGVMNLGLEGMMLCGAVTGFLVAVATQNLLLAVLAAMIAGALLGSLHALLTVRLRTDQVVSGLSLTLLGTGLSDHLGQKLVNVQPPVRFDALPIPGLGDLPIVGPVLFQQNVLVYFSYVLVPLSWFFLYRTKAGLALRSVGENPAAADLMGLPVERVRTLAVIGGGALAGLAGTFLSLAYLSIWNEGITAGRGWIAIALVIFAGWHPVKVLLGAYLFGLSYVMVGQAQVLGGAFRLIPTYFMQMLPYLLAIIVLVLTSRRMMRLRIGAPAALMQPYVRGER